MTSEIIFGDCLEVLKTFPNNHFDSCNTDLPAGVSFMGAVWDKNTILNPKSFNMIERHSFVAFCYNVAVELLRVMKPGAYGTIWALPRTSHWTATAFELAGFEIRDVITHLFGCLSEDTEILTSEGWKQYNKCAAKDTALCYNIVDGSFSWQPIQEVFIYDYNDTAYRIQSDRTDQIVSRNHRVIVERGGKEVFEFAETITPQSQICIPILESLSELLESIPMSNQRTGQPKQVLQNLFTENTCSRSFRKRIESKTGLPGLRKSFQAQKPDSLQQSQILQLQMSRYSFSSNPRHGENWRIRPEWLDRSKSRFLQSKNERFQQSSLEGRRNLFQKTWQLYRREIYTLPGRISGNGAQRQLCNGTSVISCASNRALSFAVRSGSPQRSQPGQQSIKQLATIQNQCGSQEIRSKRFTTSDLATISPIHYQGKVWCVKVPTGAFVARRNGKIFVTGNSGFPKNYDIAKGVEAQLLHGNNSNLNFKSLTGEKGFADPNGLGGFSALSYNQNHRPEQYATHGAFKLQPKTEAGAKWQGYGTALKPASEFWLLIQKPISESSIAKNVLKWGVGGINIDACRIQTYEDLGRLNKSDNGIFGVGNNESKFFNKPIEDQGRFPANLIFSHTLFCVPGECADGCPVKELDRQSGVLTSGKRKSGKSKKGFFDESNSLSMRNKEFDSDSGGASRFFNCFDPDDFQRAIFLYTAKPSRSERNAGTGATPVELGAEMGTAIEPAAKVFNGQSAKPSSDLKDVEKRFSTGPAANNHPTVKSTNLIGFLQTLTTPPGGLIIDATAGSATGGVAAIERGFNWVGIEMDERYFAIAQKRLEFAKLPPEVKAAQGGQIYIDWLKEL